MGYSAKPHGDYRPLRVRPGTMLPEGLPVARPAGEDEYEEWRAPLAIVQADVDRTLQPRHRLILMVQEQPADSGFDSTVHVALVS